MAQKLGKVAQKRTVQGDGSAAHDGAAAKALNS
jgi:hypothetical protein